MTNTFDEFLIREFETMFDYDFSEKELRQLELRQLAEFVNSKITSRNFRKNKLGDSTRGDIFNKIELSIKNNKPLYFIFAFGGYKNHNITPHHPNIGWAEVFHLIYMSKLFAPILKAYTPGVIYEFESEDVAVTVNNNQTQEDVDNYNKSFKNLISYLNQNHFPKNFEVRIVRMQERYNTNILFYRTGKKVAEKIDELKKLDNSELEPMLERTLYNMKLVGFEDLTKLTKDELREKALESLAINQAYIEEDFAFSEEYFTGDNHIPMIGSYASPNENPDNWITINSCARSKNAFWTSKGISYKSNGTYEPDIISMTKFNSLKKDSATEKSTVLKEIIPNLDLINIRSSQ